MKEADLMRLAELAASKEGGRLFRNNTGVGWVGESKVKYERDGSLTVVIRNARPLHAGLVKGSGDLIGWKPLEIAGRVVAQFWSKEIKKIKGRLTVDQENWHNAVNKSGGLSEIEIGE